MSYTNVMSYKKEFLEACKLITRDGIEDILGWLETTDFYIAPASTKYHGAFQGGLLKHSLNVFNQLNRLRLAYPEVKCSDETAAIISLFHDLCKVDFYDVEERNRKNKDTGLWEKYNAYTIKEKYHFGGHGSKSVYLIQHFMKLSMEEAAAINSHMGAYNDTNVGSVYEQFNLAWLLHVADEAATYIDEKE